jgi:cholesterol transport system auxiliary component
MRQNHPIADGGWRSADFRGPRRACENMSRISGSRRRTTASPGRTVVPRAGRASAIGPLPAARNGPVLLAVLALSAGGLFGCAQNQPQRQYYILEAQRSAAPAPAARRATLQIRPFRMDMAFLGRSLVYRVGAFRYESDYYHQFLIPPAAMLEEQTRDWLAECGLFARIVPAGSPAEPTYTLTANVTALYGDFSDPAAARAVLEIRFALLGAPAPDQTIVFARTYDAENPVPQRTADAVVAALNQDLVQILTELEADLRQHLAGPGPGGPEAKGGE